MSNEKQKMFKIVYKIIIVFLVVTIIPLFISNMILGWNIESLMDKVIKDSLREGKSYIEGVLTAGVQKAGTVTKELAENSKLLGLVRRMRYGALSQVDKSSLSSLMSEYKLPYFALYSTGNFVLKNGKKEYRSVYKESFEYFPGRSVGYDAVFMKKALNERVVKISVSGRNFIFTAAAPVFLRSSLVGKRADYILVTGRIVDLSFLNELRVALKKDFTLVDEKSFVIMSTMFNAWGESLRGKKHASKDIVATITSRKGRFVENTHLGKPYKSLYYPIYDSLKNSPLAVLVVSKEIELSDEQQMSFLFLRLITIISIILLVFASMMISRNIVRPIHALMKGIGRLTTQIAKDEEYEAIELSTRDEISVLANSFNDMAAELFQSHRELKEYSENLEEKVKDRTKELNEANDSLQEINLLMKKDLDIASTVQQAILPHDMPKTDNYAVYGKLIPMAETSGDYFDILHIDDETLGLLVADVTGHGIPAALITMMAKSSFTNFSKRAELSTSEVCERVNNNLLDTLSEVGFYLTAFFVKINTRTMMAEFTNAGHHKAIRYIRATGKIEELNTEGLFIGSFEEAQYETRQCQLEEGDRLLIFTDGIVEARNQDGDFFEEERLFEFVSKHSDETAQEFIEKLMSEVKAFYGDAQANDDSTALVLDIFKRPDKSAGIIVTASSADIQKEKFKKGIELSKQEEYPEAKVVFLEIIAEDADNVKAFFNLGIVCYKLEQFEEAESAWRRTLELAPDHIKARDYLDRLERKDEFEA